MGGSPSSKGQHSAWLLLSLVMVAAIVRTVGLDQGLWIDEIYSLIDSFRPPLTHILTHFPGDTQHPLYSILANIAHSLFGESAWSVRLPAVLFGVASVPMLYLLGDLVTTRREAVLSALLLAVSYHHVWFSQNARGYSALAFWALLSTYLLIRGLREGRTGFFVSYGVVIALGVYTHLTMVFMVAAQAVVALSAVVLTPRQDPIRGTVGQVASGMGLGALLGFVMYLPILTQVVDFFVNRPSRLLGVSTPSWALAEGLRVLRLGLGAGAGLLVAAVLFGAGLWSYLRRSRVVLFLFVLPGFATLFGALLARGTMYPRFFFYLIGFALLILVSGASAVSTILAGVLRRPERGPVLATSLVLLLVAVSAWSLRLNYRWPKQDFGGALTYLESEPASGDIIITAGVTSNAYRDYYGRTWPAVTSTAQLDEVRRTGKKVWAVYTFPRYLESGFPDLMRKMHEECRLARIFPGTVGGGEVIVCAFDPIVGT